MPSYSPQNKFPDTLRSLTLVFEGYGSDRWVTAREKVKDGGAETAIARIFERPDVEYVHVRHGEAGCFIAHINRV